MSIAVSFALTSFGQNDNPFFIEWKTPFGVPPFEQIKNEHYMPAFQEAMKQHNAEINAIVVTRSVPTFENTILPYDQSGKLLEKVSSVFFALNSANTNKEMQEIAKQLSPLLSKHGDDISMNPLLFQKIKMVYDRRDQMKLDAQQKRLVEEMYKDFVRGGANLDSANQARLRQINSEISMLQLTFGQNLLAANNKYKLVIKKKEDLAGLPEGLIATAAEVANTDSATKGMWVFTLQNPSVMPFLQFSSNRKLREEILTAYLNRCNNNDNIDNKAVIEKLIPLRLEKAKIMGYKSYADFALDDRMAKNPENVYNLLNQVWTPAMKKAKEEEGQMQVIMSKESPDMKIEAWDWRFYSEKLKKQTFDLDEDMLKPYFKLDNVREGVFYVANKLYGITFTQVKDAPIYQKDVTLWECKDGDGTLLGVLYLDFFPRASKRGGAWCGSYRSQSYENGKRVTPVVTIVCNFTPPSGNQPALLTPDETETFFHEFGHALHGLFKDVKYEGLSNVPRDFVELPSQINEHWAFEPEVLKVYAKHYITGQVIPKELVDKLEKSSKYGQGFKTTEYLAASYLDMDYHVLTEIQPLNVPSFEKSAMDKIHLIPQIPPRYRSTYFQHTMTGGYTAGYYSYIWAEVLDADAFQAFVETGNIFDKTTATKFRKDILEKGGSEDAMQMYINFRGKKPSIQPLLENRGLN